MRDIRIFYEKSVTTGELVALPEPQSKHIAAVLRMQKDQQLVLFSGNGYESRACIESIEKKQVSLRVLSSQKINKESPCNIHLFQAVIKNERMDLLVQKATELGVASITPVITNRTVVRLDIDRWRKKYQHWQSVIVSACEQCGRNMLPTLYPVQDLDAATANCQIENRIIFSPTGAKSLHDFLPPVKDMVILLGPEGGLDTGDEQMATMSGFKPIKLGPRILRAETAAITAISILQASFGDL